MDKKYAFMLLVFFVAVIAISGCTSTTTKTTNQTTTSAFAGGTNGLVISLLPGQPPAQIFEKQPFQIGVQIENKGEGTLISQADTITGAASFVYGYISLSGIDPTRFSTTITKPITTDLQPVKKVGTSVIPGGQTQVIFTATAPDIVGAQAQYPLRVAAIYDYSAKAVSTVCLKEDIYQQTISGKELCKVSGSKTVSSTGSPVKVTVLEENPFGVLVTFQNVGGGYPFSVEGTTNAFPQKESDVKLTDKDRIYINKVLLGDTDVTTSCTSAAGQKLYVINNKAQLSCNINMGGRAAETVEQLTIEYRFGYITTTSTALNIQGTG